MAAMWSDAVRAREVDLACTCGAVNRPHVIVIHVDNFGNVCCDQCGRGGSVYLFAGRLSPVPVKEN